MAHHGLGRRGFFPFSLHHSLVDCFGRVPFRLIALVASLHLPTPANRTFDA